MSSVNHVNHIIENGTTFKLTLSHFSRELSLSASLFCGDADRRMISSVDFSASSLLLVSSDGHSFFTKPMLKKHQCFIVSVGSCIVIHSS